MNAERCLNIYYKPEQTFQKSKKQNKPTQKYAPGEHLIHKHYRIKAIVATRKEFEAHPGREKKIENDAWEIESLTTSQVDGDNKLSLDYNTCTGVVEIGQEKETDTNISFMSHHDPEAFLSNKKYKQRIKKELRQRQKELKERSYDGTIDAVIVGGLYVNYFEGSKKLYIDSIRLWKEEVMKILGFEPSVITGPKIYRHTEYKGRGGEEDVFLDTQNRMLYIKRPEIYKYSTKSFYPSELESRMKEWDKEL